MSWCSATPVRRVQERKEDSDFVLSFDPDNCLISALDGEDFADWIISVNPFPSSRRKPTPLGRLGQSIEGGGKRRNMEGQFC